LFMYFNLSDIATLIKAGLMVSTFMKPVPITLWFINMLMLFYIISPLLIHLTQTTRTRQLIIYYIIFIMGLLIYSEFTKRLDVRTILYFPAFALGIFFAKNRITFMNKKNHFTHTFFILTIFSILLSSFNTPYTKLNVIINIPMILFCSHFLFDTAKNIIFVSNRTRLAILILSYSSYCMYLFHRPIYIALTKAYFPETYLYQVAYLAFFCLPCILIVSFAIQKFYDSFISKIRSDISILR
jgi:peptidoglycan/LPS O-acetylase OafA/YrhL